MKILAKAYDRETDVDHLIADLPLSDCHSRYDEDDKFLVLVPSKILEHTLRLGTRYLVTIVLAPEEIDALHRRSLTEPKKPKQDRPIRRI
jgi:hypothetical protein